MKHKIIVYTIISLFIGSAISSSSIGINNIKNIFSNDTLQEDFDEKIESLMKLGSFPSVSACIIKNSSIEWYRGYGYSKFYKKIKPNQDTIYLTGSISKSVTATAILQLYDKGLFNLTDDVNNYLDFTVRNPHHPEIPITFQMLLSHQASFQRQDFKQLMQMLYIALIKTKDYPYPIIKDLIEKENKNNTLSIWTKSAPGEKYYYSCYDYILLEHLVERISKDTFENYCRKNIFEPLEMNNTAFVVSDLNKELIAIPYLHLLGNIYLYIPSFSGEGIAGVGGMRSSIKDLSNYLLMHMHNGTFNNLTILNESTIKLMHSIKYPKDNSSYNKSREKYGFGWEVFTNRTSGVTFSGHSGNTPGGSSIMLMSEKQDVGVIIFTNKQAWFFIKPLPLFSWNKIINSILLKSLENT